ncbi:MAG TPA: alpha-amylase family protein [Acidimicrobiales bacterium]|nr:alpha-amylase family protein [Acidimicrobiales bacterium]
MHLDFHNTPFVGEVGQGFDPLEFVELLRIGHVDGIVVFAKDMHGYFYFPSRRGPVHPGLRRDLLGEQVAACRSAGIAVYAYYCVTWDHVMADEHPEWLVVRRDRTTYLPRFDETPGWTALCLTNRDFLDTVIADACEVLAGYELDGIWFDMPLPIGGECYCRNCLAQLRGTGADPFDLAAQRAHKQQLLAEFLREARRAADGVRPGCQIDQNNQTRLGLGERIAYFDNVDIEALPTGGWGYQYFPVDVRYSRTFARSTYGQTGRFHRSWADFGGLKHPRQLAVELAGIVAQGARCCIGDQPPPSGRLDRAVYETIGEAYARIEQLEDVLEGAAPVVEAAILIDGLPLTDPASTRTGSASPEVAPPLVEALVGISELLIAAKVQFDVVEPSADLERYRLLVVPDGFAVDGELGVRLQRFAAGGGALLAFGDAAAPAGRPEPWLPVEGLRSSGRSPFDPAYLVPTGALAGRLASFEYALYGGAEEWHCEGEAEIWARLGVPAFQRSPEHYTSHAQSPYDRTTDCAAVVRAGRIGATSFGLGTSWYRTGYWPYRRVFEALLDAVLPERLVRSNAPSSAEIALTYQQGNGSPRWLCHVVNVSTGRRFGPRLERFEDSIPLHDVRLLLDLPGGARRARDAASGEELALAATGGGAVEVVLPHVDTGCIVALEA